jgi:hypothetical protein
MSLALLVPYVCGSYVVRPSLGGVGPSAKRAAVRCEGALPSDDVPGGDLMKAGEMDGLRARIAKIQENGGALATPSQKYFDLAMSKNPQQLMADFFAASSDGVTKAMSEAVTSLLGALPPMEFDTQMTTTGDKLAALMLQLQMTGYMLRNAEYVVTLRKLLQLKTRSTAEYREAFEKFDLDGSGFIEIGEVQNLLQEIYPDRVQVPAFEVAALMTLFDTDGDGRISWEEFSDALGATEAADGPVLDAIPMLAESIQPSSASPDVSGNVTVQLDDGSKVEMDAGAYISQLKEEAQSLRVELAKDQASKAASESALATSLSAYVSSLPEPQLKLLSSSISEDVTTAMKQIVTYILRAPGGEGPLDKDAEVTLEQQKLQQLCLYQLILGYTLREAEATGEAGEALGR